MSGHKKWSEIKHKGGDRHVTEEVLQTYTLELIGPPGVPKELIDRDLWKKIGIPPNILQETEENLTDLLPEGYSARISEWDAEEETPNERS